MKCFLGVDMMELEPADDVTIKMAINAGRWRRMMHRYMLEAAGFVRRWVPGLKKKRFVHVLCLGDRTDIVLHGEAA